MDTSLLIFDTHPIQYRSPVFRALTRHLQGFEVMFLDEDFDGSRWWFHEVGKIPSQPFGLALREGFPNRVLGTRHMGLRGAYRLLREILEEKHPRAVLVYGYYLPEHWMLRRLTKQLRIPLLFIGETFQPTSHSWRRFIRGPLQRSFFKGVAKFIAIGKKTEAFYQGLGVGPQRIARARYCTDVSFFALTPEIAHESRRRWRDAKGIPQDAFVPLFMGRLFERKRPEDMLELHERLAKGGNVHTVIAGNGPLDDALRARAGENSRIHFVGFQSQADTKLCYYGADVLVLPSAYETWGLVVNEAFACGLPAVVTDTCGVADDLVIRGETGLVYPMGNVDEAAKVVGSLMDDAVLRARMGANAREKVRKEYTPESFAEVVAATAKQAADRA